jgi:hypothetical protein
VPLEWWQQRLGATVPDERRTVAVPPHHRDAGVARGASNQGDSLGSPGP